MKTGDETILLPSLNTSQNYLLEFAAARFIYLGEQVMEKMATAQQQTRVKIAQHPSQYRVLLLVLQNVLVSLICWNCVLFLLYTYSKLNSRSNYKYSNYKYSSYKYSWVGRLFDITFVRHDADYYFSHTQSWSDATTPGQLHIIIQ